MSRTAYNIPLNARNCKGILLALAGLLYCLAGRAQQSIAFNLNGNDYRINVSWVVRHNNTEARLKTEHAFTTDGQDAFDLAVFFNFADSLPPDNDVVWGFQFNSSSDMISPGANEKRSRSKSLFQRFELAGGGQATLTIIPKVWKRNAAGKFDVLVAGNPIKLSFTITGSSPLAASDRTGQSDPSGSADSVRTPAASSKPAAPQTVAPEATEEGAAYNEATTAGDTLQKIKALREFVDKYAAANPKSPLVAKAIKDIPLGTSVPEKKSDGTIAYTLDYAVKPVVDSATVKGWRWSLAQSEFGQYKLTLTSLHDSLKSFKIADLGKNAPFNQPKELRPFERISVRLAGLTGDSFRIRVQGGTPPFIVFLSQNRIPKWRQVLSQTDTVWAFSKDVCLLCKSGNSTLEVYDSDLSTLLLKVDDAVNIFKINYFYLSLFCIALILLVYFTYRPLRSFWQRYTFEKRLRQIKAWEIKEEEARTKR